MSKIAYNPMFKKYSIIILLTLFIFSCAGKKDSLKVETITQEIKPERVISLDGARNFRDIGGYKTKDNYTVKWQEIYRSDQLSGLSGMDYKRLNDLGIKLVIDFRTESEAEKAPTIWQGDSPPLIANLPIGSASEEWSQKLSEQLQSGNFTADDIRETFIMAYKSIPVDSADVYRKMFDKIIQSENRPSIIHCRSGKDRTGIATALILSALDVSRDEIIKDFLLTNKVSSVEEILPFIAQQFSKRAGIDISSNDIGPLIGVEEVYIQSMFEGIEANYGTVDNYLKKALGLTSEKRTLLKRQLLTPINE